MTPIDAQLSNGSSGDWLPAALWIYGLVWLLVLALILRRSDLDPVTKLTWVIVVIFVPFFGMLLFWSIAPSSSRQEIDSLNERSRTQWENNPAHSGKGN